MASPETTAIKVRKRPVVHDAILYTGSNCRDVAEFLGQTYDPRDCDGCDGTLTWTVFTMHGAVEAKPGNWIVQGENDAWPVDADQFAATYERLDSGS